ncbi:hypothetical protein D0Y65_050795 [Glycine soja]|uniref:Reverse transcriptase zinc-binding domain-containing protein n=1 Tax=Glycine soja TaxID=3848 RepID=A0A445FDL6_GLYSO|nr:hypothetical protein D0Y65_050795 [Glycine soja]
MGCWRLDRWVWKLNWRRETFEWELLEQLQILLNSVQILSNELDSWVWQNCNSGKYSTNWAYKLLLEDDGMVIPSDIFSLAWRLRRIPNKVAFLLWRAFKDRLPTKDNLLWLQCHSWMLPSMSTILSASLESHFNQFSGLGRSKSATEFGQCGEARGDNGVSPSLALSTNRATILGRCCDRMVSATRWKGLGVHNYVLRKVWSVRVLHQH